MIEYKELFYKKAFKKSFDLEIYLLEFIEECLKDIFQDKYKQAINCLEEYIDGIESYGCFYGNLQKMKKDILGEDIK